MYIPERPDSEAMGLSAVSNLFVRTKFPFVQMGLCMQRFHVDKRNKHCKIMIDISLVGLKMKASPHLLQNIEQKDKTRVGMLFANM